MKLAIHVAGFFLLAPAVLCAADPLEIRILFDNTTADSRLQKGWGFAAAVTMGPERLLFDTGASAEIYIRNFDLMKLDAASFDQVFVSHRHGDHTMGLSSLQARNPKLRVLWPDSAEPFDVAPHFHSTGGLNGPAPEQALVIDTPKGLVIMTGCSHPGVVKIVETALKQRQANRVRLLIGGFHMLQYAPAQTAETIAALRKLNVERIAATHCTGPAAIERFREAWGKEFETAGAGRVFRIE